MTTDPLKSITVPQSGGGPTLHCLLQGGEPRFLFVHGSNSSVATWVPVMSAMAALGWSSIAVDLRGHGKSSGREQLQRWRMRHYVGDVVSVLGAYPTATTVVGHSMGGLIGQLVAAEVQLQRLILIASSPVGGMLKDGLRMFARHPATFLAAGFKRSFARLYRVPEVARSLLFHPEAPDRLLAEHLANLQDESWLGGSQLLWVLPEPAKVRCPVSVIGGTHDAMVSPASVEATARAYGVAPIFVAGTAHMVPTEADPGAFAELLIRCMENG